MSKDSQIPCKTKRMAVNKPQDIDRVSFVVPEAAIKELIREWVNSKGNSIGPEKLELPESFEIEHYIDHGDADIEVTFDLPVQK